MSTKKILMGEALRFGWETMKANTGFLIGLIIVAFLIQIIPRVLGEVIANRFPLISLLLYLTATVLEIVVSLGLIKVSLYLCDGKKGKLDDLLSSFNLVFSYFAAAIVYMLIVTAGMFLLVVPGVIWGIKYSLFPYMIVDQGLGPIEAIKASGKATRGVKFQLFLLGMLLGLVNLCGVLALGVGLFISIPVTMVAYAYVYRQLSGKKTPSDSEREKTAPKGGTAPGIKGTMYIDLQG